MKKTISISDNLNSLIGNFNIRHPYEKLNISQIAQKAVFEKIKSIDPELVATMIPIAEVAATAPVKAKKIVIEEEPAQSLKKEPQLEPVQKTQKKVKAKPEREIACVQCGEKFSATSEKARFCSGKCRTAYSRESKKLQS